MIGISIDNGINRLYALALLVCMLRNCSVYAEMPESSQLRGSGSEASSQSSSTSSGSSRRHARYLINSQPRKLSGSVLERSEGLFAVPREIVSEEYKAELMTAAESILTSQISEFFGGSGKESFQAISTTFDPHGNAHIRTEQIIQGMPLEGAAMMVHIDKEGAVKGINGQFSSEANMEEFYFEESSADPTELLEQALKEAGTSRYEGGFWIGVPQETVVRREDNGNACLAWKQAFQYTSVVTGPNGENGTMTNIDMIFADAAYGSEPKGLPENGFATRSRALCAVHPQVMGSGIPTMRTYSCQNTVNDCSLLLSNSPSRINTGDLATDTAHNYALATYKYYWDNFGRDSLDDNGATLISNVHYGVNYNNAFWNGVSMTYGDGDGTNFGPFSSDADVVAHELTHGVTTSTSNLIYRYESGALNEAMSDVFGAMVDRQEGATGSAIWYMGEDLALRSNGFRNMADPAEFGHPDYYPDRRTGSGDNGGVHSNSGIMNLAYVLLVEGGTHPRGKTNINVPGIGFSKAAEIFYWANVACLTAASQFADARFCTDIFANISGTDYTSNVHLSWDAVGVPTGSSGPILTDIGLDETSELLGASIGEMLYFKIAEDIPLNQGVSCKLQSSGGTGDADLYVGYGDGDKNLILNGASELACTSGISGSNEECLAPYPSSVIGVVGVYAYSSFNGVSLRCTLATSPEPQPISNGISITGLSGSTGTALYFEFDTSTDVGKGVSCVTSGGGGGSSDADLFMRLNNPARPGVFGSPNDCFSGSSSSSESCELFASEDDTTIYVTVHAYSSFSSLRLTCNLVEAPVEPTARPVSEIPSVSPSIFPSKEPTMAPTNPSTDPMNPSMLSFGQSVEGFSGGDGVVYFFAFTEKAGTTFTPTDYVICTLSGPNGDASLGVRLNDALADFDCVSNTPGTSNEYCGLTADSGSIAAAYVQVDAGSADNLALICELGTVSPPTAAPTLPDINAPTGENNCLKLIRQSFAIVRNFFWSN